MTVWTGPVDEQWMFTLTLVWSDSNSISTSAAGPRLWGGCTVKPCAGLQETRYTAADRPLLVHWATTEPPAEVSNRVTELWLGVGVAVPP
ncbi:MAG: hypothetical protein ACHQE5_14625, partial [Actinomycetes bacterium]